MILTTIALLAWQCGLLPILLGGAYAMIGREKLTIIEQYGVGWIWLFAGFMVVAAPLVLLGKPLSLLTMLWLLLTAALTLVLLVLRVSMIRKEGSSGWGKNGCFLLGLAVVFVGVNFLARATYDGDLVEIISRGCATDSMYRYDSYTGRELPILKGHALAPFEMYYAMLTKITGVIPGFMVRKLMPVFLTPMLVSVYEWLGRFFYEEATRRRRFVGAVVAFDVITWLSGRGEGFLLLSGAWHPQTILCSAIIPMTLLTGLSLWERRGEKRSLVAKSMLLIALMLAAELMAYKGLIFWGVALLLASAVGMIRRKLDGSINR